MSPTVLPSSNRLREQFFHLQALAYLAGASLTDKIFVTLILDVTITKQSYFITILWAKKQSVTSILI